MQFEESESSETSSQEVLETKMNEKFRKTNDEKWKIKVQEMSIQWLDIQRVEHYIGASQKNMSAEHMITAIIEKFNKSKEDEGDEKTRYILSEKDYPVDDYKLKTFFCIDIKSSRLSQELLSIPVSKADTRFILFFYKDVSPPRIFAITTDQAYLVLRKCIDYDFPIKVAEKIGNPQTIDRKANRYLFGENITEDLHVRNPGFEELKTSKLYFLVESFKCEIKCGSSLSSLKVFSNTVNMPRIKVTTGGILRILREMPLSVYPEILDLFERYVLGEETLNSKGQREENDSGFEFLHFLQAAPIQYRKNLNDLLIKEIHSQYQNDRDVNSNFYLHPKFVEDFLSSDKNIEIKIDTHRLFQTLESRPPRMEEIIDLITERKKDLDIEVFKNKVYQSKLRYYAKNNRKATTVELLGCIEGEIVFENKCYFKIRNMWYEVTTDFISLLLEDFINVLRKTLVKKHEEMWLPKPYIITPKKKGGDKRKDEPNYNKSYESVPGYICFDKVTPDGIEICDILKYTETEIYLYHVKQSLAQNTRVVCSQLFNAAKLIRSAKTSNHESRTILDKLWDEADSKNIAALKEEPFNGSKETFINFFYQRSITFIVAYVTSPRKSFSLELEKKRNVTRENLPVDQTKQNELFEILKTARYIDSKGRITGKFYSMSKNKFKLEGDFAERSGHIFDHLVKHYPSIRSTIEMLELVQLAENVRKLNSELKICEIDRKIAKLKQKELVENISTVERTEKRLPSGDFSGDEISEIDMRPIQPPPSTGVNPKLKKQKLNASAGKKLIKKKQTSSGDSGKEVAPSPGPSGTS